MSATKTAKTAKKSKRKFYLTEFTVRVLSETPLPHTMELKDVAYYITEGEGSGVVEQGPERILNGIEAAAELELQGSDPAFFGLTPKGEDAER